MPLAADPLMLLAFMPAALALNLTPGADMMFALGQGLRGGPGAAISAAAGISAGCLVHVTLAALGLGAVMAAHPALFDLIRWLGVCYLLWLVWGALRMGAPSVEKGQALTPLRAFRDGFLVNLANPKVILFVLAFIPQFVDPGRGAAVVQFLIFGVVLSIGGMIVNSAVGLSAGRFGRMATSDRAARALGRVAAGIFAVLAQRLALLQRA